MPARLVALTTCLVVASCVPTRMTGIVEPSAANTDFKTLVVLAALSNLESRVTAEEAFVDQLQNFGVRSIPSVAVLPPSSLYTEAEFTQRLAASGADGMLLVSITDSYTVDVEVSEPAATTRRVPRQPSGVPLMGSVAIHGGILLDPETEESDPGLTLTQPRIHTEVRLFDVSTGQMAWLGTSETRGGIATRLRSMMESLANTTGKELREQGLIAR